MRPYFLSSSASHHPSLAVGEAFFGPLGGLKKYRHRRWLCGGSQPSHGGFGAVQTLLAALNQRIGLQDGGTVHLACRSIIQVVHCRENKEVRVRVSGR